jgi:hypothetical protein
MSMLMSMNRSQLTSGLLAAVWLGLWACGGDATSVCVGPGCPDYDATGGRSSIAGDGGSSLVDAGSDAAPDGGGPGPEPCNVAFVTPVAGDITLVGGDDADGEQCGPEFTTGISVSTNGTALNLFINNSPLGARPVDGPTTDFLAVLGNRGATPNELRVEATMEDGRTCSATFAGDVFVDCAGPSCSIQSPVSPSGYLNQSQDGSPDPGLQTDIVVRSETENAGQPVRLEIDDVFMPDATGVLSGSDSLATFSGLTLNEGERIVQAECRDSNGTIGRSTPTVWQVDITPCTLDVSSVAGGANPITTADDADQDASNGLQVEVAGQIGGGDCRTVQLGEGDCSGPTQDINVTNLVGGNFSEFVTISPGTTNLTVCGRVIDVAGNVSNPPDQLSVAVNFDAPLVAITSPAPATVFNLASGCDASVEVSCSEVGSPVELFIDATSSATTECGPLGTVSIPVTLATKNNGDPTVLLVRHTASGFASSGEATINVSADCEAPVPSISAPICGSQQSVTDNDENPSLVGLQSNVTVQNTGVPLATLTVTRGASSAPPITATGDNVSTTFAEVDLGIPGDVTLSACVTDAAGNPGCSADCAITVVGGPAVAVNVPATGGTLTLANTPDCDIPTAGLDATVSGTTTAADGSTLQVTVGVATPVSTTVAGGVWSACVPMPNGDDQILTASVVDAVSSLPGALSITVSVDAVPSASIAAPTFTVTGRREGTVDLNWVSVLDSDGGALSAYRLRCATTDIVDESGWAAAADIPVSVTPAATAGVTETFGLTNFKTGMSRFCVVRGEETSGNLSPIAAGLSATVSNPFLSQAFTVEDDSNTTALTRMSLEPVGDINGDTIPDFAYGATLRVVQVFFGGAPIGTSPTLAPDFQLTFGGSGVNTVGFGSEVTGVGDVNGDDISDFAVGVPGANTVFIFFGRDANTWTDIDVDATSGDGCEADICITAADLGGANGGQFGWEVSSTNFDGVGPNDLLVAARFANTNGQAFVITGGTQLSVPGTTLTVDPGNLAGSPDGFVISPPAGGTQFGFSIGAVGNDLLVGALGSTVGPVNGAVYLLPSRPVTLGSGLTALTTPDLIEIDSGPGANFGVSVRGIGDYDGDGFEEFAAGENFTAGGGRGIATVYRGSASGYSSGSALAFTNNLTPTVDDNYGTFIAAGTHPGFDSIGDLDGDGFADLLVGASTPDSPGGSRGSAQLFYGAPGAGARTRATADFHYTSSLASGQVIPNFLGDVNDDGFNDLAILDSGTGANVVFLLY